MPHRALLLVITAVLASTLLAQDQAQQQKPAQPQTPATVTVPSTLDGTVKEVRVKAGDQVKSGQPLLTVIPDASAPTNEAEKRFAEMLTKATLIGQFTNTADPKAAVAGPREERYTISSVRKLFGDRWLINARIQYGGKDVTVPMVLPVKFADDTPMISLTDLTIPGLGTYTARVLFYRDHYAGTWSGGKHGGHLWGRIERPAAPENAEESKQ
jgi:pyruvate/2-oxoglutarate dehydrogenase complex dihydrolipoamide acyltransferase (E2) component